MQYPPVDTSWFLTQLNMRDMNQSEFATRMGLHKSNLSLMIRGKQNWSAAQVAAAAETLNVSVHDVMCAVGLAKDNYARISARIDGQGVLTWDHQFDTRTVPTAPEMDEKCHVARFVTDNMWNGWLAYFSKPSKPDYALDGRLCVVNVAGQTLVRHVSRQPQSDLYTLTSSDGIREDDVKIGLAAPIIWLKQC